MPEPILSFSQALADFFVEQPGYEHVWGVFRIGYKERLEKDKQEKRQKGIVIIPDCVIRESCEEIVRNCKLGCGEAFVDPGDPSDLLDETKHNAMIASVVNLVKKSVRENQQYNSYVGMYDLFDSIDFRVKVAVIIGMCCDERGHRVDAATEGMAGLEMSA